eukprot:gene10017-11040_t
MESRRGSAPMNPVTLCGCSSRHQQRIQSHHHDDPFHSSSEEPNVGIRSSSPSTEQEHPATADEQAIRRRLSWYFMNPYQKYKVKGRKPWKLLLQIFKIILITAQAAWFAVDLQSVVSFGTDNLATFRHIFIKNYPGGLHYVPIFTKQDLYERMFYVWSQYHNFSSTTVGWYDLPEKQRVQFCISKNIHMKNNSGDLDADDQTRHCHFLKPPNVTRLQLIQDFIRENKIPDNYQWISSIELKFSMKTKNLKQYLTAKKADCYKYDINAKFSNEDYDGLLQYRLDFDSFFIPCDNESQHTHNSTSYAKLGVEILVIILCIFSFGLCFRSLLRHLKLCKRTTRFFKDFRHEDLTLSDKMNFINFWIILMILSDILVICGTIFKIIIDFSNIVLYDICSLLLGTAVLFSWIGILRYLGFLRGYNTLLVTLKVAFPPVMRFIVCAGIIYFGFAFCGWVVFGPYHEKFKTIVITSDCLFSLVNGDDMFNTFKLMEKTDTVLWIFSKIYLYVFISLFIFVVLSLFIGIISDTYERIKDYGHPPKTRIQLFMEGREHSQSDSDSDSDAAAETFRNENFTDDDDLLM